MSTQEEQSITLKYAIGGGLLNLPPPPLSFLENPRRVHGAKSQFHLTGHAAKLNYAERNIGRIEDEIEMNESRGFSSIYLQVGIGRSHKLQCISAS